MLVRDLVGPATWRSDNVMGACCCLEPCARGGANRAFWCNEEFSALLATAKQTADVAERTKLYEQAQVIFKDQAPWATLDHSTQYVPMAKNVTGFVMSPLGDFTFDTVDLTE